MWNVRPFWIHSHWRDFDSESKYFIWCLPSVNVFSTLNFQRFTIAKVRVSMQISFGCYHNPTSIEFVQKGMRYPKINAASDDLHAHRNPSALIWVGFFLCITGEGSQTLMFLIRSHVLVVNIISTTLFIELNHVQLHFWLISQSQNKPMRSWIHVLFPFPMLQVITPGNESGYICS